MAHPDKALEPYEEALRRKGRRLTAPRRRIVQKLLSLKGHHGAEEIQDLLKKDGTPVS